MVHNRSEGLFTTETRDQIPANNEQQLGFINTSIVTENDAGYTGLQRQVDGYERLRHNAMEIDSESGDMLPQDIQDSSPTGSTSTNQSGSMETEIDEPGYLHPRNQSHEYLELVFDEHPADQTQSSLYDEIPASLVEESEGTLQQSHYGTWTM